MWFVFPFVWVLRDWHRKNGLLHLVMISRWLVRTRLRDEIIVFLRDSLIIYEQCPKTLFSKLLRIRLDGRSLSSSSSSSESDTTEGSNDEINPKSVFRFLGWDRFLPLVSPKPVSMGSQESLVVESSGMVSMTLLSVSYISAAVVEI
jgi:hypothetical protein